MPRGVLAGNVEHTWVDVDTGVALRLKDHLDLLDIGDFDIDPTDIMKTTWSVVAAGWRRWRGAPSSSPNRRRRMASPVSLKDARVVMRYSRTIRGK